MLQAYERSVEKLITKSVVTMFQMNKKEINENEQHNAAMSCHLVLKIPFLGDPSNESGKVPKNLLIVRKLLEIVKIFSMFMRMSGLTQTYELG